MGSIDLKTTNTTTPVSDGKIHKSPLLALILISGAQLMIMLDLTIVNVALPSIKAGLGFSPTALSWVVDAYTLVFGGLLLLGGRSGDIFGRRKMFTIGVSIFAAASFAGGLADTQGLLIAARAIQGIGAAIASPTALALIATNFKEGKERTEALGIFASVSAAGASLGLISGGFLTEYINWRWVFFVNIPVGALIAIGAPMLLRESEKQKVKADVSGSLLSVAGIGSLVYGLIHSASTSWSNKITVESFIAAAVLLIAFVIREATAKQPLLRLGLLRNRNRSGAYAIMLVVAGSLFALWFFLTQFLQEILGYSPIKAGLAFLPMTISVMLIAKFTSRLVRRIGPLPLLSYGAFAISVALFWLSHLNVHSTYLGTVLPALLINATGIGITFATIFPTAMTALAPRDSGLGSALVSVSQQIGGTLGISIMLTVSAGIANSKLASLVSSHSGASKALLVQQATAYGWSAGFKAAALMAFIGGVVALATIRNSGAIR